VIVPTDRLVRIWIHGLVFLSAFFLFFIQPLAAKAILPAFGGTAGVWSTTLFFFQLALLLGYLYVHGIGRLPPKGQAVVHGLALALAVVFWRPGQLLDLSASSGTSVVSLLLILAVTAGPFFLVLSAGSPLLQHWYASGSGGDPYPFYATSNTGSIAGLAAYPLVVEPLMGLPGQIRLLQWGFALYAVLLIPFMALWVWKQARVADQREESHSGREPVIRWILYPLLGTVMLAAVTRHLTSDVAPIPLLWTLPLACYLLGLVFCFAPKPFYPRLWVSGSALLCLFALMIPWVAGTHAPLWSGLPFALGAVAFSCWLVHGEMVRLRPEKGNLTLFYLCLAFGGVLGGGLVALVAPLIWNDFWELNLVVAVCSTLAAWILLKTPGSWFHEDRGRLPRLLVFLPQAFVLCFAFIPLVYSKDRVGFSQRNFYGKVAVVEEKDRLVLVDGRTHHGVMALDPAFRGVPGYFGPTSGARHAWEAMEKRREGKPLDVAVLGLGAGCLADYMREGDRMLFLEINPAVLKAAEDHFDFLRRTRGKWETRLVDGRAGLVAEPEQSFDLIFMDAFSSGSVPVHLITREAVAVYMKRLRPGGAIIINISNRHLFFPPLVRALAEDAGLSGAVVGSSGDGNWFYSSLFAVVTAGDAPLVLSEGEGWDVWPLDSFARGPLWTDHFSNIPQLMFFSREAKRE